MGLMFGGLVLLLSGCSPTASTSSPAPQSQQIGESWQYGQQAIWRDTMAAIEYVGDEHYNVAAWYLTTYNLVTGEKRRLLEVPADRIFQQPSIYQDKIVWAAANRFEAIMQSSTTVNYDIMNWDIFLYNLTTGETQQITTDTHAQLQPQIYEDNIVWLDNRNAQTDVYPPGLDIYAYNLITKQERRLTSAPTVDDYDPLSINGNNVVWADMRHADPQVKNHAGNDAKYNNEIYLYDLATNQERRITANVAFNDHYPCIDGSTIVWLRQIDYRQANVYAYDLASSTGKEIQISKSNYAAGYPSVSSGKIVWQDARASRGNTMNDVIENGQAGASDIYLYDLHAAKETKLTAEDAQGHKLWAAPVICGNYILYMLDRQIGPVIYALSLPK